MLCVEAYLTFMAMFTYLGLNFPVNGLPPPLPSLDEEEAAPPVSEPLPPPSFLCLTPMSGLSLTLCPRLSRRSSRRRGPRRCRRSCRSSCFFPGSILFCLAERISVGRRGRKGGGERESKRGTQENGQFPKSEIFINGMYFEKILI